MKNIFLKETDQKSKLYRNLLTDKLFILEGKVTDISECNREYQFIYITNDEEIKFDDYITDGYKVWKWKDDSSLLGRKKVVMTNDTSLIEDGVQQVNSSFLSFFAENTPDYVRVEKWLDDEGKRFYSLDFSPKKENKTEENIIDQWLEKYGNPEIMKQVEREAEELELEIEAQKLYPIKDINWTLKPQKDAFIKGAKWQAERMYSEEEVHIILNSFKSLISSGYNKPYFDWFEQFKKQTK